MKSDDIQVRMQLDNRTVPRFERPPNEPPLNERNYSQDYKASREYDDDEEDKGGRFVARGPAVNLSMYLLIFVFFAIMDFINLIIVPTIWTALPLIVHGVFLPLLFYIVYKQRQGDFSPRIMVTFIQLLIVYMIVYLITDIIVAGIFGYFLTIAVDIFIGFCMVMMWRRVLQQMKYMLGRQQ